VAHYTTAGTEKTAVEIDKSAKMVLSRWTERYPHRPRRQDMAVKTADGTEDTFRLTDHAAADAGKASQKEREIREGDGLLHRTSRQESGPLLRVNLRGILFPATRS